MKNITENLKSILNNNTPTNKNNLERQNAYYKDLVKKGIAKKETYKLKPVSAI
jgi:hypothetical protein